MDEQEALDVLGLADGASAEDLRAAFRRQLRRHHPDRAARRSAESARPVDAEAATRRVITAHEVLSAHLAAAGTGRVTLAPRPGTVDPPPSPAPAAPPPPPVASPVPATRIPPIGTAPADGAVGEVLGARALDEDTLAVGAPPAETYALLHEAASRIGDISYLDAQLGILEMIVRFEGGPSCSVMLTLQGRALHTEVFVTMESIESTPAPPIGPVVEALVATMTAITGPGTG